MVILRHENFVTIYKKRVIIIIFMNCEETKLI